MPESNKNDSIFNVKETKNPVLFKIQKLLSNEAGRDKQEELTKLCFEYLMDNKSMAWSKTKRENFDKVLNVLRVIDSGLANYVEEVVDKDKVMQNHVNKESSADPRIENLKELLKRLKSKEVNPWHHFNSEKFDKLVKSVEHAIEYANAIDKGYGTVKVLDKMFDEIKDNTLEYLDKKSDSPDSKYGQSRINLALATLLSVDREKGMRAMDTIANKRLIREKGYGNFLAEFDGDISKMKLEKSTLMSLDKIIKETGYKDNITREEMSQAFIFRMENINKNAYDSELGMDEMALASYIVFKAMSDILPTMKDNEWKTFDVSIDEINQQSMRVMTSDPFLKAHMKMFNGAPLKQIDPDGFFMAFNVIMVEDRNPQMGNSSARFYAQRNYEQSRQSQTMQPDVKNPRAEYKEIKEFLHMDDSATFSQVRKNLLKEMGKHHPDRHKDDSEQERNEHIAIFQKLNNYKDSMDENEKIMREVDDSRSAEMSSPQIDTPARRM